MSRAVGRLGWGDQDTLDANELNTYIPYLSVYFPANVMVPGALQPTTFQTIALPAPATETAMDVQEYPGGANTECYFTWQFRNHPINLTAPEFKIAPQFFQIDDAVAPAPAEYAYMEFSWGVSYEGTDITYDCDTIEVRDQCLIPDAYDNFMYGTSGNVAVALGNGNGDGSLSGSNFNFICFQIERWGGHASDTYGDSVYLAGCALQYRTDFNNIAVWPT